MQVRDLIEELKRFDPHSEVLLTVKWKDVLGFSVRESKTADKVEPTSEQGCRVVIVSE
jgi:hypothetical protein